MSSKVDRAGLVGIEAGNGVNGPCVVGRGASAGRMLWLSPALPGRSHDLTAARTHKIIRVCGRQGVPILADMAWIGAGKWVGTQTPAAPGRTHPDRADGQPSSRHCPPPGYLSNEESSA